MSTLGRLPGEIVILNGTPRSGKSSIAAAIQEAFDGPWMNLGVDAVKEAMTPQRYQPGIGLRPGEPDHPVAPLVPVFYAALYESIAAHSRLGLNIVADTVHHDAVILADCARRLAGLPVLFVGVRCPLAVVEARELARADRSAKGVVRWQFERVHAHGSYDLEVDTSVASPLECAERIKRRALEGPAPETFERLRARVAADTG